MGRKKVEVDFKVIDTALFFGATLKQLQDLLLSEGIKVTTKTIQRIIKRETKMNFEAYREIRKYKKKFSILQKQYQVAMNGNVKMLIHLGEVECGQDRKGGGNAMQEVSVGFEEV